MPVTSTQLNPTAVPLQGGNTLYTFADEGVNMLKLDLAFEAGSVYQPRLLCAAAALQLLTEGGAGRTAQQVAEFVDYRGIVIERSADYYTATLTAYFMPKYAADFLPLLRQLAEQPAYSPDEVRLYAAKRRQQLQASQQRTSHVARVLFNERLFGADHPFGAHATPADADGLSTDVLRSFHSRHYSLGRCTMALAGHIDEACLELIDSTLGAVATPGADWRHPIGLPPRTTVGHIHSQLAGAAQTTLRLGRLLPYSWNSPDYARFMVLNAVLGGYFGSRLMSNLREDKGYTYGIYSQTCLYRSSIVFFITAEVDNAHRDDALQQVRLELDRLRHEPIPQTELDLARNHMRGELLRTVDGVFERSEHFVNLHSACADTSLTLNLQQAIDQVTPQQLQREAQRVLDYEQMTIITVGC